MSFNNDNCRVDFELPLRHWNKGRCEGQGSFFSRSERNSRVVDLRIGLLFGLIFLGASPSYASSTCGPPGTMCTAPVPGEKEYGPSTGGGGTNTGGHYRSDNDRKQRDPSPEKAKPPAQNDSKVGCPTTKNPVLVMTGEKLKLRLTLLLPVYTE